MVASILLFAAVLVPQGAGLPTAADWSSGGRAGTDWYGLTAASAGDVNGDGYDDVIVGAPQYDNGTTDEGAVFVFHGSPGGLSTTPSWQAESGRSSARFGYVVASAGDINRDGYGDVAVGSYTCAAGGVSGAGIVHVYLGGPTGLPAGFSASATDFSPPPSWTLAGTMTNGHLGRSLAAGDFNGDGFDDLAIGEDQFASGSLTQAGRVQICLGSPAGLSPLPSWSYTGTMSNANVGISVSAGDLNGDDRDDLAVGAFRFDGRGAVYVFLSGAAGPDALPTNTLVGAISMGMMGQSVAIVGDVNRDGFGDLLIGSPGVTTGGRAYLHAGSGAGVGASPAWTFVELQAGDTTGVCVAAAGDVNDDGYADVLVGAKGYDVVGTSNAGRAYVFTGSPAGLPASPSWLVEGTYIGGAFGVLVAGAGDVNGDTASDVLVGASVQPSQGTVGTGSAYVYHGTALAPSAPAAPQQYERTGATVIPPGGEALAGCFVARATVNSPGDRVRLEVEVKPLSQPFDGNGTVLGREFDAADAASTVFVEDLPRGIDMHWRLRTVERAMASAWVEFGTGDAVDFETLANRLPRLDFVGQFRASDGFNAAPGSRFDGEVAGGFRAELSDPDGEALWLQIEVRTQGDPFRGEPTAESDFVVGAGTAEILVPLPEGYGYCWTYRAIDESGEATPWAEFGDNAGGVDFALLALGSVNTKTGCGNGAAPSAAAGILLALVLIALLRR